MEKREFLLISEADFKQEMELAQGLAMLALAALCKPTLSSLLWHWVTDLLGFMLVS